MNVQKALEIVQKASAEIGADQWDVLAGETRSSGLTVFNSQVDSLEVSNSRGIGIRIFREGFPGYSYTERFSEDSLKQMVKDAWSHTSLTAKLNLKLANDPQNGDVELQTYNPELESFTLDELRDFSLKMEKLALEADERIENVPYLGASLGSSSSWLVNSAGFAFEEKRNSISGGLGAMAALNEQKKLGYYTTSGRSAEVLDPENMSQIAVERALELLGAKSVASGVYPIVFSNRVSSQLMNMFASTMLAEMVQKGQSRFQGKLGEVVASSCLSILNDPWRQDLPGSAYFDSEGVPTQKFHAIKDGRLENFLYNLESAAQEGVSSTGSASRGYSGRVSSGFSNFIVESGNQSLTELLQEMGNGLYIVKLEGGSGCSAVSGEISIGAQGFLIENGQKVHPVDGITLSGNFFDMIQNIQAISSEYTPTFSSVKVPDLLINGFHVAG